MSSPTISSISVSYSSLKKRLKEWNTVHVLHEQTPVPWFVSRDIMHSISLPMNPRAFKLLSKWQGKVTLLLWLVIPPSKQACPMQIWWPQRPRNEKLKTFWKIKIYLLKWEPLKCLFQRQGGKKTELSSTWMCFIFSKKSISGSWQSVSWTKSLNSGWFGKVWIKQESSVV